MGTACGLAASRDGTEADSAPALETPATESSSAPPVVPAQTTISCAPELIDSQAELDALEGCEIMTSGLMIAFDGADLMPLRALRVAEQGIVVGNGLGSIPSLAGLESLERAGGLELQGISVADLRALRSLRSLGVGAEAEHDGVLSIVDCPNLTSLDGLQQLDVIENGLTVAGNPLLTSLWPLKFPLQAQRVELIANPALLDLEALATVEHFESLLLDDMPQVNLDDFSALHSAAVISLRRNSALADVTGITGLESVWSLTFLDNPSLRTLPEFGRLSRASSISVWANPLLEQIEGFPVLDALLGFDEPEDGGTLDLVANPVLARVVLGPMLAVANAVEIVRNPSLVSIALDNLASVNQRLIVASNPQLDATTLGQLETILAPSRKVAGNQPAVPLADPCPWTLDGYCDEPPVDGLCALGTDSSDCSTGIE